MTIGQIKASVLSFFNKDQTYFNAGTGPTAIDLLLNELNEQRKLLEKEHDFEANNVRASLTVSPTTGGQLSTAVLYGTATTVKIKSQETYYLVRDGAFYPLYHHKKKNVAVWNKEVNGVYAGRKAYSRYPGDAVTPNTPTGPYQVYVFGDQVDLVPTPTESVTLALDCQRWMADYTLDANTDWLVENGSDYLKWAAICALNYKVNQFVPMQDGNLPPPVQAREKAREALILWDSYQIEGGRQPFSSKT